MTTNRFIDWRIGLGSTSPRGPGTSDTADRTTITSRMPPFHRERSLRNSREVEQISRQSALPPDELTAHVLTDAIPILSRWSTTECNSYFTLPSGQQINFRCVTVTFRTADLTFAELRERYDEIREYMGGKGVRSTGLEDLELWNLVEELGGPPQPYKGVRRFWLQVLERWNADHPEREPLKSWEGLQKRYKRLRKRLGAKPMPFGIDARIREIRISSRGAGADDPGGLGQGVLGDRASGAEVRLGHKGSGHP